MSEAEGWACGIQRRTAMEGSTVYRIVSQFHWLESPTPLCSSWCLSFILSVPLFCFHFHFFCLDNRNVQSFFNGARNYISSGMVQYCCPLPSPDNEDVCLKRYMALVLISNYTLSLCLCVSSLFTETIFTCQTACHKLHHFLCSYCRDSLTIS